MSIRRLIIIAIIIPLTTAVLFGSTIKTRDGKILEGRIEELIFVKSVADKASGDYYLFDPEGIVAIDEQGVHLNGSCLTWSLGCIREDGILKDDDVVKYIQDHSESAKSGGNVRFNYDDRPVGCMGLQYAIRIKLKSDVKILGRFISKDGRLQYLPNLAITTKTGSIEIPVAQVVEFTKK